jgi:uncharacterized cofD-like protein
MKPPAVVAFGGGHGLAAALSSLRLLTPELTAVVTVADDGGSSGRLRSELGALPPGDLRMALHALAGDDEWAATWARLLQHRFTGPGGLAGHPVGNLILVGLTEMSSDPLYALDAVGKLLGACGRVLPMAVEPVDIVAEVAGLPDSPHEVRTVRGQVAVATTPGRVVAVRVEPEAPAVCPEVIEAVRRADWVLFGPGSWFTSVIPHLLVPDLAKALHDAPGRRMLVLNLAPQPGETAGFSPTNHLEALVAHAPDLRFDAVLAERSAVGDESGLALATDGLGAQLFLRPLAENVGSARHDPRRLATALAEIFEKFEGRA